MKMLLFSRNEQYIATLRDVLSAKHTEELNGENVLEIETLNEIEKNQRLIYKDKYGYWHEFIVRGVEEERAEAGIIRRVFAEHSFYETWGDYIEDKRPYDVTANIALENALLTTRWEVGIVDDLGLNSTNFYHISAKEAVQKVAETWQGELRYRIEVSGNRITGRYVDLLARRGYDLGKRFTYTKDLISITKTVHRDDVITALYGYGKGEEIVDEEGQPTGGYGRRIDFADINNGKAYVENLEAKEIWGRLNPDGTKAHVFGKVEFDDVEDPHELLELTKEKLKELSQPHITYEAKVIDLKALGIEHEGVELGDWVGIVDKEFKPPLRLKARVIKIVRDLLEPENNDLVLGNFIPSVVFQFLIGRLKTLLCLGAQLLY
jgi:phage minor structural protein